MSSKQNTISIIDSKMSKEFNDRVFEMVEDTFNSKPTNKERAKDIKAFLDVQYGTSWQVVIGSSFTT